MRLASPPGTTQQAHLECEHLHPKATGWWQHLSCTTLHCTPSGASSSAKLWASLLPLKPGALTTALLPTGPGVGSTPACKPGTHKQHITQHVLPARLHQAYHIIVPEWLPAIPGLKCCCSAAAHSTATGYILARALWTHTPELALCRGSQSPACVLQARACRHDTWAWPGHLASSQSTHSRSARYIMGGCLHCAAVQAVLHALAGTVKQQISLRVCCKITSDPTHTVRARRRMYIPREQTGVCLGCAWSKSVSSAWYKGTGRLSSSVMLEGSRGWECSVQVVIGFSLKGVRCTQSQACGLTSSCISMPSCCHHCTQLAEPTANACSTF